MTHHKTKFERLFPCDQTAIETQMQKAKKEEFEYAYRETKAKETLNKYSMSCGEVIMLSIIVIFVFVIIFIPLLRLGSMESYIKQVGPSVCKANNGTYIETTYSYTISKPTIVCSNGAVR